MFSIKIVSCIFLFWLSRQYLLTKATYEIEAPIITETRNKPWYVNSLKGFMSTAFNPKSLIFYLSLFSLIVNETASHWARWTLGIWMILAILLWNLSIMFVLSQWKMSSYIHFFSRHIDNVAGTVMGILALIILIDIFMQIRMPV